MKNIEARKRQSATCKSDMKSTDESHKKVLSAFDETYAKWVAKTIENHRVQITLGKGSKHDYMAEAYSLIIFRMAKWYATETLDSVKKKFKHAKKESKLAKNKIRPATPSPHEGRTLQMKKQKQNKFVLSKSTCPICLEQSFQIETICGHNFCRECFQQHERMSEKCFLCSYCRTKLSRNHKDFVWVTSQQSERERRKGNIVIKPAREANEEKKYLLLAKYD